MRLKIINYLVVIFFILISVNLIFAAVTQGNISGDIETSYGRGEIIRGWINISLNNEDLNTTITYRDQSVKLIDLIRNNSASDWNCSPIDCNYYYSAIDGYNTKTFNLTKENSNVLGLWVRGILGESVTDIYFNVTSDSAQACSQQLMLDITEDNDMDWIPTRGTGDYNCSKSMGNYDPVQQTTPRFLSPTTQYCEKMNVPPMASMQVGADITKTSGTGAITMSVYDMDANSIGGCEISSIPSSGEYYCVINNIGFLNYTDIYVCVKGPDNYQIKGENTGNVSGFYGFDNRNVFTYDYSIFVKGGKYDRIGSFIFNSDSFKNYIADIGARGDLKEYIRNYLSAKYNNNCPDGCIIPIKFIAGENQQVVLSNLVLKYGTTSGNTVDNKFYNLIKRNPKLNSGFIKLDLSYANFTVPDLTDNYTVSIRVNGADSLIRKDITVKLIPAITNLTPLSVPALVPTNFRVYMGVTGTNMSYIWNFGDNSSEEITNITSVTHTFQAIGSYPVNIKVRGSNFDINKTFNVQVVSPRSMINSTIISYEADIANFERQLGNYSGIVKTEIERYVNLIDIKEDVSAQKKTFNENIIDDNKAVEIMSDLLSLKIPTKIHVSNTLKPSSFIMSRDQLDLDRLSNLGAGNREVRSFDDNYKSINNWVRNNIDVMFEAKSYSVSFRNKADEQLFSNVIVNLNPKNKIDELYFIVNGDTSKTRFKEDFGAKDKQEFYVIIFSELDTPKTIDFVYPPISDFLNLPVVISPKFSELTVEPVITTNCNLNGICEKEREEDSSNCSDCKKSWLWIVLIGLAILLIVFFIIYIILQEWYKKRYETYLFRDRNQLYNLIHFMNNSEIQGIPKSEYFRKLREMGWSSEQLNYAWRKLHGLRTGMWEIPIFKGSENRVVKQELLKRQNVSRNSPAPRGFNTRTGIPPGRRQP